MSTTTNGSVTPNLDGLSVVPHVFDDALPSNNHIGWSHVAAHLDRFAQIVQGRVLVSLTATVRAAEEATASLFCAVITAKRENLELGFASLFSETAGRSFGSKLINWAMVKADIDVAADLKVAWGSFHQQMSSTMEMLIRDLEPALPPTAPPPSPASVVEYIQAHGGIGKLHMAYMSHRRTEKANDKSKREIREALGKQHQRLEEAKENGFEDPDAYDAAKLAQAEQERADLLRSKFEVLKLRLIQNGTVVTSLTPPKVGAMTIYGDEGKQYVISPDDEFSLLSCSAATL